MILVVGATGHLGRLITRNLLDAGKQVRILVRGGSPYDDLEAAGAEPVRGDLKDPASLAAACEGADTVVTTANSAMRGGDDTVETVDRDGNRNLVDAASAAGVQHFVFTSALGASTQHPAPFMQAKAETEHRVRDSGMAATILEPNLFMDVWLPAVVGGPALAGQPVTLVGTGQRRHSFVAIRDVAAYAAGAVTNPVAEGTTLMIGGPEAVTWPQVVAAFEQALGHPIPVTTIAPGQPVPGLPEVMNQLLAAMDTYDSDLDMTVTAATYGVTPTSVQDFARDFVARAATPS